MPLHSEWVIEQGRAVGFDKVGVAPAANLDGLEFFPRWLARGYAGKLDYLHNPKRRDVRELLPGAQSVICCALNYDTNLPRSTEVPPDAERSWISRYAWGDDYHGIIEKKLEALRERLAEKAGKDFQCKLYVDTGPVLERVYATHAGLGWQAKNTCLLDPGLGSFFFVGLLVTNLMLETNEPPPDGCGACTLCVEACPTDAITEPYVLDARRCISYLTIELRDSIPEELRQPMGRHVFGCDICQDVCPYNDKSLVADLPQFQPRSIETTTSSLATRKPGSRVAEHESLFHPHLNWLARLDEDEFRRTFAGSPLKRAKHRGLLRNTIVAMGNSGNPKFRPVLQRFAGGDDPLLAEHAQWALDHLPKGTVPAPGDI